MIPTEDYGHLNQSCIGRDEIGLQGHAHHQILLKSVPKFMPAPSHVLLPASALLSQK